jgi:hypothetical protein
VNFTNEATATAPAQAVTVTEQLDPNLDWSTFQFGDIGFGTYIVNVPPGRTSFSTQVDATATLGVLVDITANFNLQTGLVTWTFTSLDPATLDLPMNPTVGFLPPNENAPDGQGFVTYTVSPKPDLATGVRINAQATVVFDTNAPISTAQLFNTVDSSSPTSSVSPLPPITGATSFPVSWSGSDGAGSGIASYNVYVSDNGGAYTPFVTDSTATSATFTGQFGHTYSFYSVATDNVGNVQPTPIAAQATTQLEAVPTSSVNPLPATTASAKPSFTLSWSGSPSPGATSIASYSVFVSKDSGPFTAFLSNTTETSATFTGQFGHTYGFYSIATDNLGLVQPTPTAPQASTYLEGLPTSNVNPLPATTTSTGFTMSWSGTQGVGAGPIASYTVFASEDGGPFAAFVTDTTATSATFTGQFGHTYAFYSIATDNAGNVQPTPTAAQATTYLAGLPTSGMGPLPPTTASATQSFMLNWSGSPGPGATRIVSYTILASEDSGLFTPFLSNTTQTSATFKGQFGHTYSFYCLATDNLGLVGPVPAAPQAKTYLEGLPTSNVNPLPATTSSVSFTVSWSGTRGVGAGPIATFSVFVSVGGGKFVPFLTNTTHTSATFTGKPGNTYGFYSVATDNLGNSQPTPKAAQATTKVVLPPPVTVTKVSDVPNKKTQVTQILVTFSGAVNATEADNIGTYRLTLPGKGGSYTAKNAKSITLRSAVYNGKTDSVALTPSKPFALTKPVQLLVYGTGPNALKDSNGRAIDGAHNGKPGSNAVVILSSGGVKVEAVTSARSADRRFNPVATIVDALLERNALLGITQAIREHLDRGLLREWD